MITDLIRVIFTSNLSFTGILLAVIGIIVQLYRTGGDQLKKKYSLLLKFLTVVFALSLFVTISSFLYILNNEANLQIMLGFDSSGIISICFILEIALIGTGAFVFIKSIL